MSTYQFITKYYLNNNKNCVTVKKKDFINDFIQIAKDESTNPKKDAESAWTFFSHANYEMATDLGREYELYASFEKSIIDEDINSIQNFLDMGLSPNKKVSKTTVFGTVCRIGNLDILNMLLEYEDIDPDFNTIILSDCVLGGNKLVLKKILDTFPEIVKKSSTFALRLAITNNRLDLADILIDHGMSINSVADDFIITTIKRNLIEATEYIINKTDVINKSPILNIAVSDNNLEIVKMLIRMGADQNNLIYKRNNPLVIAIKNNMWEIFQILMQHNPDIDACINELEEKKLFVLSNLLKTKMMIN